MTSKSKSQSRSAAVKPRGRLASLASRRAAADEIFSRLAKKNPNPKCELFFKTPYQLLVSVVLSAQTTDKSVNAAMTEHYKAGFSPATVKKWGQARLQQEIRTIGLAPTKAKNIVKLTDLLLEKFGGKVPKTHEELVSLPGVGQKTANVIMAELYQYPTLAVDTHVFRVGYRLGLHREKTAEKAETELLKVIDTRHLPAAHHWLILQGRYTCKAIKPLCDECLLTDLCPSFPG